jgi:hypothetical protein
MPTLTTLINFDGTNGQGPYGLVLDANGNLLGTTGFGGGGYGHSLRNYVRR